VLLCFADLIRTLLAPRQQHGNPWSAPTLEWLPKEEYGVRSIPQVTSLHPLWDRPALVREVQDGRHWLPGTLFGGRETLVTSPLRAEIRHLLRLPGDGWLPFVAAVGTAGFFLLLTVSWIIPAFAFGALSLATIVAWLWASDQPPPRPMAQIGEGVFVLVGATGRASHSWWAMVVLLCVDASIFASLAFAHIHLAMGQDVCPPAGAALPAAHWAWGSSGLLAAGSGLLAWSVRRLSTNKHGGLRWAVLAAIVCVLVAFALDTTGHAQVGLNPSAEAWSATVAALLGWQGLHVAILFAMGLYVVVRSATGRLRPDARATLDNTALMWHYVTAQGVLAILLVRLLPVVLG
jgi:cytochrome c oxidase subunit I+III